MVTSLLVEEEIKQLNYGMLKLVNVSRLYAEAPVLYVLLILIDMVQLSLVVAKTKQLNYGMLKLVNV